jgi:hypothetical protein
MDRRQALRQGEIGNLRQVEVYDYLSEEKEPMRATPSHRIERWLEIARRTHFQRLQLYP